MGDGLKRAVAATKATRETKGPKLVEIAGRITAHLQRFEADPKLRETQNREGARSRYYDGAFAKQAAGKVRVGFVPNRDGSECVAKSEALAYLAWLDAGNAGRLVDWRRATKATDASVSTWTEAHELAALERLFEIALMRLRARGISEETTARNLAARATSTQLEFTSSLANLARMDHTVIRREVAHVYLVVAERERGG